MRVLIAPEYIRGVAEPATRLVGAMIPSLQDASFYFIVNHITSFSAASLALLPSHVRLRLLSFISAIDLWRLNKSPAFCRGLTVDEEWRRRVATHITAWKAPKGLEFNEREATFRESYLRYTLRLLLTSTGEELMQGPSQFHVGFREDYGANRVKAYYERLQFCFHLRRANPQPSSGLNDPKLLTKRSYIHFLFYGIRIEDAHTRLLNYAAYVFDPQKKYFYSCRNAADVFPSWPLVTHRTPCVWFQKMVTLLKESSGWIPRKLDIVAPSHEFLEAASSESVSEFLSSVKDINVKFFNDVGFSEVADVLTKLFKTNKLSAESICIKMRYEYQVTWLLPRLAAVCGRLSPCDQLLFPHLPDQQHANGYCGVRNITISTHSDGNQMSSSDWGVVMFQDKLESITLRACIPTNFPYLLSHLLATRPSLRLIDLTGCWNDYNSLQLLISTFLFAFTDHPQSLVIRELLPGTGVKTQQGQGSDTEIELPAKVSGPCQSGEHKTLCLPFISSGPCSLAWLLSLPELSLKNLEITMREEGYESRLNAIHLILQSHKLSQFQFECTISVCCASQIPPLLLRMTHVISQLRMCPPVKDVRFIIDNNI